MERWFGSYQENDGIAVIVDALIKKTGGIKLCDKHKNIFQGTIIF